MATNNQIVNCYLLKCGLETEAEKLFAAQNLIRRTPSLSNENEDVAPDIDSLRKKALELLENASDETVDAVFRYIHNGEEFQKELDHVCGWPGLSGEKDYFKPEED